MIFGRFVLNDYAGPQGGLKGKAALQMQGLDLVWHGDKHKWKHRCCVASQGFGLIWYGDSIPD
jgi:hypothetical protein